MKKKAMIICVIVIVGLFLSGTALDRYFDYHAKHNDKLVDLFVELQDPEIGFSGCSNEREWNTLTDEARKKCEMLNPTEMGHCDEVKKIILSICNMKWDNSDRELYVELFDNIDYSWKKDRDGKYIEMTVRNVKEIEVLIM